MWIFYNQIVLPLIVAGLRLIGLWNPKIRRGFEGRRNLIAEVDRYYQNLAATGKRVLIHVASFGELEQAKPVIEAIRKEWPETHIHLTFFSPSGFEGAKRNYHTPDLITYSPIDSEKDVSRFLDAVRPDIALFTRYDVWPNMARLLHSRNVPSILFSATYSEASNRSHGLMQALNQQVFGSLSNILAASESDSAAFIAAGVQSKNVRVAGDTRFDQVIARRRQVEARGEMPLPASIANDIRTKGTFVFIIGSSWEKDEAAIAPFLKKSIERKDNLLTIIAPHEPGNAHVAQLLKVYGANAIRFSELSKYRGERVIIVDSVGKLFSLYQAADVAFVGGGFSSGVHNVLEPAVWGKPVIVGPNHTKSSEVQSLINALGAFEVKNARDFEFVLWRLMKDEDLLQRSSNNASQFVQGKAGATVSVLREVKEFMTSSSRKLPYTA